MKALQNGVGLTLGDCLQFFVGLRMNDETGFLQPVGIRQQARWQEGYSTNLNVRRQLFMLRRVTRL